MAIADATTPTVRRLAEFRGENRKVLSLYVNLDPSAFPTPQSRRVEVESLLAHAERRYLKEADGLTHEQKVALREDIAAVRNFFEGQHFTIERARGAALFCCGPSGLFEVIRLPRAVSSEVVVDDSPFIEPLHEALPADGWCVFLVNRRSARILLGTAEELAEVDSVRDAVHGWHDQGGWSQARYQRGIEKEIRDHVKHACEVLFDLSRDRSFRGLVVGTPRELWPEVESSLHPYLRNRLVGRIEVDIEHSTPEEIRREAHPVVTSYERSLEQEALERLEAAVATGGRGVAGLAAVLQALNDRRVEVLLCRAGFRAAGVACPACTWVATAGKRCPIDSTPLERREDVVENAIELALAQSAEVLVVRHHDSLKDRGSIGAILRF